MLISELLPPASEGDEDLRDAVDSSKEPVPHPPLVAALQAAIGGRLVARSTVKALRKDVIAKGYGGNIEITQGAFLAQLEVED